MAGQTTQIANLAPPDNTGRIALGITFTLMILACGGFSLLCAGLELGLTFAIRPGIALLSAIMAGLFGVPYLLIILWLDRNEREPWYLIFSALVWGAILATSLSGIFNSVFGLIAGAIVRDAAIAHQLMASLSAPFIEELTKGAALLMLYFFFRHEIDNVLDGVVYGALIGLGFAVFENWMYYVKQDYASHVIIVVWVRGVVSAAGGSHATFTALTGLGIGLFRVFRRGWIRWLFPPAGLAAAMFMHFSWNTFTQFIMAPFTAAVGHQAGGLLVGLPLAVVVIQVPFLLFVLVTAVFALRHERKMIEKYLSTEKPPVVHEDELYRLVPARRRSFHNFKLFITLSWRKLWRTRWRNHMLVRLAFEKWHMDAELDGEIIDARAHAIRVKELRDQLKDYQVE